MKKKRKKHIPLPPFDWGFRVAEGTKDKLCFVVMAMGNWIELPYAEAEATAIAILKSVGHMERDIFARGQLKPWKGKGTK